MSKSKIFIGLAISFAFGIWLEARFLLPGMFVLIALAFLVIIFALTYSLKSKAPALSALFLFAVLLGSLRLQVSVKENEYGNLLDSKQKLEGYIVEDPDVRLTNQFLTFRPKGYEQRILITMPLTADYSYGDWAVVEGKVVAPEIFDDFDYPKYLERFNVYALIKYPKLMVLKSHQQNKAKEFLLNIKHAFTSRVSKLLPEPQSSLLMGILIGARKTLPKDVVDNFNATGTSHIIAISGYNISVIVGALGFLAYAFGRRARFWLTLIIILGFVILSGASASVIRAAIMGSLLLFASNIGRQYSVGPALFFAALIMLIINPKILYWDVSFQLSFLATLGIVYFQPLLEQLTEKWDNPLNIKSILLTTLSAIVATLPLILFIFGRLSVVAPLVNILILPFLPLTMLLGFLSVLPIVGTGCAFAANLLLKYILMVANAFAHIPFSNLSVKISQYTFILLGMLVLGGYLLLKRSVSRRFVAKNVPVEQ